MKLLFATDIHGANRVFTKFLNSLRIFGVDVGIVGGDIMGKKLVPIVIDKSGSYSFEFFGQKREGHSKTASELVESESILNDSGYYTYKTDREGFEKLSSDSKYLDETFERVMFERLESWVKLVDRKLDGTKIKVFMTGGNDDLASIDSFLKARQGRIVYCESEVVRISDDNEMLSSGYANITPWKCPRDIPEEELEQRLEAMTSKVTNMRSCIFNLHVPPISTSLDECPKLDTSVYPPRIIVGETTEGGSKAVRKLIEKHQPMLSLHGHIHESRGLEKLGKTLCINPGSEYNEGVLRAVMVNIDRDRVKGHQFISS